MLSQFFVLSPRGDTIISRLFRGDVPRDSAAIFFRNVKFWNGEAREAPPVFWLNGVSYLYIKAEGLYFMCTTRANVSPSLVLEMLIRCSIVFKDYCGVLNEEAIRKNFVLIYELLDEMLDYGFPQDSSTEKLKAYVFNKAVATEIAKPLPGSTSSFPGAGIVKMPSFGGLRWPMGESKTAPSDSVNKPIDAASSSKKNEIYVDIVERLSVTFNSSGYMTQSEIDGTIVMKSFLSGSPELRLAVNEELIIGKAPASSTSFGSTTYGAVVLDDVNFHDCVKLEEFDSARVLSFHPPDGQFNLLNYRVTQPFRAPFRLSTSIDSSKSYKLEISLRVRADFPEKLYASSMALELPLPKEATASCTWEWDSPGMGSSGPTGTTGIGIGTVSSTITAAVTGSATSGHEITYDSKDKILRWKAKKVYGGKEFALRVKIALSSGAVNKKEIGPLNMTFEIPMYNVSNLQIRYLRIAETSKKYNPYRWVRYITKSNSYVCRLA